jgi:hypothetical protein
MKIKGLIMLVAAMALIYAAPVSANVENDIVNSGDDVDFTSRFSKDMRIDVDNRNDADIDQRVFAVANTGGNVVKDNIAKNRDRCDRHDNRDCFDGNTSIKTGDANVFTKMHVDANKNWTEVNWGDRKDCDNNGFSVVNTGDNLDVDNRVDIDKRINVDNRNNLDVDQRVFAVANTGLNFVEGNIGDVSVKTGDAAVWTDLSVTGNTNWTKIN